MATFSSGLRRGLPRIAGGEGWPPAGTTTVAAEQPGEAPAASAAVSTVAQSAAVAADAAPAARAAATEEQSPIASTEAKDAAAPAATLRRGLPRTPGGEPWPAVSAAPEASRSTSAVTAAVAEQNVSVSGPGDSASRSASAVTAAVTEQNVSVTSGDALRRGLPRTPGGEPWPAAGMAARVAPAAAAPVDVPAAPADTAAAAPTAGNYTAPSAPAAPAPDAAPVPAAASVAAPAPNGDGPQAPLPFTPSVWPGRSASLRPSPRPEPERVGPFTKAQWAGAVIVGGLGLLFAAAMAVLLVRVVLSFGAMQDFLATYPGEYHLPEGAPVGIPAWLGWQHFFNVFLMVLIIRTGLTIRREKRPTVFWAPKNNPKGKTSLTIWFHQALDLLWIVNGLIFVVLLFVTGQWMRIVPTSWEVVPNAISAALQYVSLDWPTENGWVNYNALQQLAYFSTVFLAAPLAIVTGFRMSAVWPKNNTRLSAAYPIEWARKVHFPTMLYFVVFIVIHVALVFATGALRNLNHMYAAQGSVDPTAYADNWTGFWMFVLSLAVIAGAWVAARPLVLAPIARLFGTVSGR